MFNTMCCLGGELSLLTGDYENFFSLFNGDGLVSSRMQLEIKHCLTCVHTRVYTHVRHINQ